MKEFNEQYTKELKKNNNETIVPYMERSIKTVFEKYSRSLESTFNSYVKKMDTSA